MKRLYCDVETTGFGNSDKVLEIGAIYEENGEVKDTFQIFIKHDDYPENSHKAEAVHGITQAFLEENGYENKVAFDMLLNYLDKKVNKFDKEDKLIFAGYNANFDVRMVNNFFKNNNNNFFYSYFDKTPHDVLKSVKELKKQGHMVETIDSKLGTIAEYFGFTGKLHSAIDDIKITRNIDLELKKLAEQV